MLPKNKQCKICGKPCMKDYCSIHKRKDVRDSLNKFKSGRNLGNSYEGYLEKAKLKVNKAY